MCGELLIAEHESEYGFCSLRACGLRNLSVPHVKRLMLWLLQTRGDWRVSGCHPAPRDLVSQVIASGESVLGGTPRWTWASRVCCVLGHLSARALDWRRLIRARFRERYLGPGLEVILGSVQRWSQVPRALYVLIPLGRSDASEHLWRDQCKR